MKVNQLLGEFYRPCVSTYFGNEIFDSIPFLKNVYDSPANRNANIKAIYMFSTKHNFNTTDAESFLFKYGMVLLPLFLPWDCMKYADDRAISDVVLTIYSPMLAGMWTMANELDDGSSIVTPPSPVEIHIQRDCTPLNEIHKRVSNHLFNHNYNKNRGHVIFIQMNDSTVNSVERTGKSIVVPLSL